MSAKNLKLGVMLPTRNVVTGTNEPTDEMNSLISIAIKLDDIGCGSIWVGDSLLGRPRPEPLIVLAAIAACTKNIELGTAALLPAMRHPLQLTQQLATLDLISNGRTIVGVGSGFPNEQTKIELEALGLNYDQRIQRAHEVVAWCRAFWGHPMPDKKTYWQLEKIKMQPKPSKPKGPAFWLGGSTDLTQKIVGRRYNGWMPTSPDPEQFNAGWKNIQEVAINSDRNPSEITAATILTVAIHEDGDIAKRNLNQFIEAYYQVPLTQAQQVLGCRSGTLEEIVESIKAFHEAGVEHCIIRFASADQSTDINRWLTPLVKKLS